MASRPRRTIEAAVFDRGIGLVSASELLGMPESKWGLLRDRLTDRKQSDPDGLTAKCLMCEGRVFIQSRMLHDERLPYLAHYSGSDVHCPWYQGHTASEVQRQANLIEYLLRHTPLRPLLDKKVGEHIRRAKKLIEQTSRDANDAEWAVMKYLVPEVFDPVTRYQLTELDALPKWAMPPTDA
jgi:hypothetical protein